MNSSSLKQGYLLGVAAYLIWGLFPLYFKQLASVPALEVVVQRALGSALVGCLLLLIWKHPGWLRQLWQQPKLLLWLSCSGLLIACNWLLYVWAVSNDHMLEASLGYYINPLVNVLLGMLVLGERLRPLQWLAVSLAGFGVAQQLWQLGELPWLALMLAITFAVYGLLRKKAPVAALPGLVIEAWLLVPLALGWLLFHPESVTSQAGFWSTSSALWILLAGPITLLPLLCFTAAAKRLPYTALGFLQYLAPTMVLLIAVLIYQEPISPAQGVAFLFIWAALLVYSIDLVRHLRRR